MKTGKDQKPHIGIYGRRNNGKSSLINKLAGQEIAIVADVPGTTTDPVKKSYEITGFGAVVLVDTAGIDDVGSLGNKRISKTLDSIAQIDLALLVIANNQFGTPEKLLIEQFGIYDTPFIIIHNKSDLQRINAALLGQMGQDYAVPVIEFSTLDAENADVLVDTIRQNIPDLSEKSRGLLGDLVSYGDVVLLITPIDIEAPAGRLILPQVQAIRDVLDNDCVAVVLKEREVDAFLRKNPIKPKLAITDSQLFLKADASVPRDIPLTSFSILLARMKGDFENYLKGTPQIDQLQNGDRVLLLESCTHHVSCDDIGRVKIPRWMSNYTGKQLQFDVVAGLSKLERPVSDYALVVQCGGCMITPRQLANRLKPAIKAGVPVTNYGMTIAYIQGIYKRAIRLFMPNDNTESNYL